MVNPNCLHVISCLERFLFVHCKTNELASSYWTSKMRWWLWNSRMTWDCTCWRFIFPTLPALSKFKIDACIYLTYKYSVQNTLKLFTLSDDSSARADIFCSYFLHQQCVFSKFLMESSTDHTSFMDQSTFSTHCWVF